MNKTMKQLRENAEIAIQNGVGNKAALYAAVPLLIELQEALDGVNRTAKATKEIARRLSDACSAYALEHQSVFDEGLVQIGKGVRNGELTIDETTYHFTSGYDKPKRLDGDAMSQDFLDGLPDGWTKTKLELDTTGINRLGVTETQLEEAGLFRSEKNEWK